MSSNSSIALAALLAAGAFALPAAAAKPQEAMVVVRDANTGKLRPPTAAELRVLQAKQATLGLVKPEVEESLVTIRPNGTVHKHLGEKAMVYSVVRRDGHGKLGIQCVAGQDAADAALAQPASAAAKEHDHETR